jgi:hypothetical protein
VLTVGDGLPTLTLFSTASRRDFAARHADAFVGYWFVVPIFFERRLPFSHQKKFHVLIRLSSTTLPFGTRALFIALLSCAEQRTARSAYHQGQHAGIAKRGVWCRKEGSPSLFLVEPTA